MGQPKLCPGEMQWLSYEELPAAEEMGIVGVNKSFLTWEGVGVALDPGHPSSLAGILTLKAGRSWEAGLGTCRVSPRLELAPTSGFPWLGFWLSLQTAGI